MAYCVNCGVKLATSEKKCPLCFTPIYHPNIDSTGRICLDLLKMPPSVKEIKGIDL